MSQKIRNPTDSRTHSPGNGILLLGTVKGLGSETGIVEECFREYHPQAVGLHISPEELKGLRSVVKGKLKEAPMSSYDMVYARKLSRFGEVQIPSPALVEAYRRGKKDDMEILPLDMDDQEYSKAYTDTISGLSMIRSSLRLKSVNRKKFDQETVEEFILEWDRAVNGTRAFRKLETARESHMAERIRNLSDKYDSILCIVELERLEGISSRL